jgi:hypothetical protein
MRGAKVEAQDLQPSDEESHESLQVCNDVPVPIRRGVYRITEEQSRLSSSSDAGGEERVVEAIERTSSLVV